MARKTNTRNTRDEFVIITNGKESEVNYFELLKKHKSIYKVKVLFHNGDPIRLVNEAMKYISNSNQVWVVFDMDNTHFENRFVPAINQATKSGVKFAISNLSFEVWLISHFERVDKYLTMDDLEKILNKYLHSKGYKREYNKADKNMLNDYFINNYQKAVENSKAVYQIKKLDHIKNFGENSMPKYWEWNSFTSVYKLVEALKFRKK